VLEASRWAVGEYANFRVFSERHPYGWDASGTIRVNALDLREGMVLYEWGRKTYTVPWRYFANGLVFTYDTKG